MTLYEQIKEDHQFCTFTGETGRRAFCSCGESRHPWATREESHEMHFAEMFEQALRTQIADDIQERLVPADQTEVAVWIRNQAARIVEEGTTK